MHSKLDTVSEDFLRSVRPRLICLVEIEGDLHDPEYSPLGTPVYWRIVNRGAEQFPLQHVSSNPRSGEKGVGKRRVSPIAVPSQESPSLDSKPSTQIFPCEGKAAAGSAGVAQVCEERSIDPD